MTKPTPIEMACSLVHFAFRDGRTPKKAQALAVRIAIAHLGADAYGRILEVVREERKYALTAAMTVRYTEPLSFEVSRGTFDPLGRRSDFGRIPL